MFSFLKRFKGSKSEPAQSQPDRAPSEASGTSDSQETSAPGSGAPLPVTPTDKSAGLIGRPATPDAMPGGPAREHRQHDEAAEEPHEGAHEEAQWAPQPQQQLPHPPRDCEPAALGIQGVDAPERGHPPAENRGPDEEERRHAGASANDRPPRADISASGIMASHVAVEENSERIEIVPPPAPEPAAKRSWLSRLKSGLSKTSSSLTGLFIGVKVDEALFEELETALLMADAGIDATQYLLDALREKVRSERLTDAQQVKGALRQLLVEILKPLEASLVLGRAQPLVIMIAGVNGAGKTTSIGKLAKHLQSFGQSVLLAAGDTFRAAAREQLTIWGQRNDVTVISQDSGDAAAVIFDAVGAARARKIDVLMADTAGRLPTQLHLMEELRKVKRVIGKALDGAPHEVLLVLDANTGQNALAQVKAFDDALGLTGLIVTKLDGTAKGGILAAIARQRPVPVYFIGVGEKLDDLQPFVAEEFADALLG
jgi:fused signal recognition particle receptor